VCTQKILNLRVRCEHLFFTAEFLLMPRLFLIHFFDPTGFIPTGYACDSR
jgi:hypothetical protein